MVVTEWIANFARRLAQLDHIAGLEPEQSWSMVQGPVPSEAYITATRQAVAHRKKWSLETLYLRLDLERVSDLGALIVDDM